MSDPAQANEPSFLRRTAEWPTINLVRADIVAITARLSRIRNRHVVRQGSGDDASEDTLLYSDGSPPEEE